jgi:hypothetical protein
MIPVVPFFGGGDIWEAFRFEHNRKAESMKNPVLYLAGSTAIPSVLFDTIARILPVGTACFLVFRFRSGSGEFPIDETGKFRLAIGMCRRMLVGKYVFVSFSGMESAKKYKRKRSKNVLKRRCEKGRKKDVCRGALRPFLLWRLWRVMGSYPA